MKNLSLLFLVFILIFLNSTVKAELKIGLKASVITDMELDPSQFCSGYETSTEPALGKCPTGTIGLATCQIEYKTPFKLVIDQVSPNTSFQCELDTANKEQTGERECEYSRCLATDYSYKFEIELDDAYSDWLWN